MRIVITGSLGYVGAAVISHLREKFPEAELIGFDSGLVADCLTTASATPETLLTAQHFGDLRDADTSLLRDADAVVHLAAVSNEAIGARFEAVTDLVNRAATLRLATIAAAAGVRNFVFASSCALYGATGRPARQESDPLAAPTAYARAKIAAEDGLRTMARAGMAVTCLRFATACGMSERLRLDLPANAFVASAIAGGRIEVPDDGTPWEPLIDVHDIARTIEWAILRPVAQGGEALTLNVGRDDHHFRLREIADAVAAALPGTTVVGGAPALSPPPSYRVDFSKFKGLAPEHQPQVELLVSIGRLVRGLRAIGFADPDFRRSDRMIRLNRLSTLVRDGALTSDLRWRRALQPLQRAAA
jgi:nucleoside-diphosphate-sugar epimerase